MYLFFCVFGPVAFVFFVFCFRDLSRLNVRYRVVVLESLIENKYRETKNVLGLNGSTEIDIFHVCLNLMSLISVLFLFLEVLGESILSIQSSEKVTSISLPPTPPYHTLEFHLEVLCVIPSGPEQHANEWLTNGEVRHRPRSYSLPDTPMTAIDLRVRRLHTTVVNVTD